LGVTLQLYSEIESNIVDIKASRLYEIASILEVNPEDILAFDEKQIFNIYENQNPTVNENVNTTNPDIIKLIIDENEKRIKLIIEAKDKEIEYLKLLINELMNKSN
jgi:transcriptional regulator with XRE-family HTH domain